MMEHFRDRIKRKFTKKHDNIKIKKQQSKLTSGGIHKSYENCDSYTFKLNKVLMGKMICVGFAISEQNKLHMYETYYDKLQPYFGQENIHLHYIDTDSFVLSTNTKKSYQRFKKLRRCTRFQ